LLRLPRPVILLRVVLAAPAGQHLGAADQHRRVDAEGIADQPENDHRAEAETASADHSAHPATKAAAGIAAAIFDIAGLAEIFPSHCMSPRNARSTRCSNAGQSSALRHVGPN